MVWNAADRLTARIVSHVSRGISARGARLLDTGVVDEDVGTAPCRDGLRQLVDPVRIAQVAVEELRLGRALVAQVVTDLLDLRIAGEAMHRDPRAGARKRLRRWPARSPEPSR